MGIPCWSVGTCRLGMGMLGQPWISHVDGRAYVGLTEIALEAARDSSFPCDCFGFLMRQGPFWRRQVVTHIRWSICAITRCACLFWMIFEISSTKASGYLLTPELLRVACLAWQWAFLLVFLDKSRFALCSRLPQLCFAHVPFPFFSCPLGCSPVCAGAVRIVGAECLEEGAVSRLWRRQGGNSWGY